MQRPRANSQSASLGCPWQDVVNNSAGSCRTAGRAAFTTHHSSEVEGRTADLRLPPLLDGMPMARQVRLQHAPNPSRQPTKGFWPLHQVHRERPEPADRVLFQNNTAGNWPQDASQIHKSRNIEGPGLRIRQRLMSITLYVHDNLLLGRRRVTPPLSYSDPKPSPFPRA
jgi:hypothetical protein